MEALNQQLVRAAPSPKSPARFRYLPALPTLWPGMLAAEGPVALPFPFNAEGVRYYYFARNAVWTAVKLLRLSEREILVPAYHHGVEVEALLDAGALPRFYPIGPRLALDPAEVIARMGPKTAAVYVIHYLGFPQPLDALLEACRVRGIPLIEDCALSLLSKDGDVPLGSRGDVSLFCLYKTLPVPNGGALVVNGQLPRGLPRTSSPGWPSTASHLVSSLLSNLRLRGGRAGQWLSSLLRLLGHAAAGGLETGRVPTGTQHFDRGACRLGMSPISSRILANQHCGRIVEVRRRNFFFLLGRLRDLAPPLVSELPAGVCPLFYPLLVERKDLFRRRLASRGIEAIDFWRTGHPLVRAGEFPEVDRLREQLVELPIHQDFDPAAMEFMALAVREALHG